MSLQPKRPALKALRDTLRTLEADPSLETPDISKLKGLIRQRIREIESHRRPTVNGELPAVRLQMAWYEDHQSSRTA